MLCLGKVWQNVYVCGIGLFSYLNYVSPFLKRKSWRVISIDVSTKHHVIKAEHAQTKSGDGAIGYRRELPSVEITLPRNMHWSYPFKQMLPYLGYNMTYELTIHIRDLWQLVYQTFNPYGIYFKTTGKKVSYFVDKTSWFI